MGLKEELNDQMKASMKSGDKVRLSTIRMLLSEIKNAEIAKRGELTDEELMAVVSKEAKVRKESIEEFSKGGRQDLVDKESKELKVLEEYLPEQMSEDELRRMIGETIEQVGASSPGDIGKVMGSLMPRIRGKADGKLANQIAREMLELP
jgi:uncharacterized protein